MVKSFLETYRCVLAEDARVGFTSAGILQFGDKFFARGTDIAAINGRIVPSYVRIQRCLKFHDGLNQRGHVAAHLDSLSSFIHLHMQQTAASHLCSLFADKSESVLR